MLLLKHEIILVFWYSRTKLMKETEIEERKKEIGPDGLIMSYLYS